MVVGLEPVVARLVRKPELGRELPDHHLAPRPHGGQHPVMPERLVRLRNALAVAHELAVDINHLYRRNAKRLEERPRFPLKPTGRHSRNNRTPLLSLPRTKPLRRLRPVAGNDRLGMRLHNRHVRGLRRTCPPTLPHRENAPTK